MLLHNGLLMEFSLDHYSLSFFNLVSQSSGDVMYIYIYIDIYIYIYVCIHVCNVCMFACVHVCVSISLCVDPCIYIHI